MDIRRCVRLCVGFIVYTEWLASLDAAVLDASYSPKPGVIGNNILTVRCNYTLRPRERFSSLMMINSTGQPIASFYKAAITTPVPTWDANATDDLTTRATVHGSSDLRSLELRFADTRCDDVSRNYTCSLTYGVLGKPRINKQMSQSISIDIVAPPLAPEPMIMTPDTDTVTEVTKMTFTCMGNVGLPPGIFQWFTVSGDQITKETAKDEESSLDTSEDGCTFTRQSSLTLTFTPQEYDQELAVRCRIHHPLGNPDTKDCSEPAIDFCRASQQIHVQPKVKRWEILKPVLGIVSGLVLVFLVGAVMALCLRQDDKRTAKPDTLPSTAKQGLEVSDKD